ncbi:MAG TPA: hypothetical protein VK471_11750 [Solirubrobacterales bacterium]|nr:hypothetical protein [Solirubrobacterales bacterium]
MRNSLQKTLRGCRRRRGQPRRRPVSVPPVARQRVTEQGNTIDVALIRGFLKRALEDDAVADSVNDLLFEHVVAGRFHPSVVAESLPSCINEILVTATGEDWQAVADELIAEAREVNGEV